MSSVPDTPVFKSIDISRIDSENFFFKISFEPSPSGDLPDGPVHGLRASIARIGLVCPPVLKSQPDNRFQIVSGFRRIAACRSLGWQKIPARIMGPASDDGWLMKLAIADNAFNRSLNIIEQATAVFKLAPFLPKDAVGWRTECDRIGVSVNPGLVRKLKKIHEAPEDLKEKMAAGKISLTVGLDLAAMEDSARVLFLSIFDALNPTLNHQKEMLRLTSEITGREEKSAIEILNSLELAAVATDPDLERTQKISRIRHLLRNRRYPEISGFEKTYHARVKRLKLPESIVLHPPADFEGNDFMIRLTARDLSQFKEVCDTLLTLRDHPDFAAILEKRREDN